MIFEWKNKALAENSRVKKPPKNIYLSSNICKSCCPSDYIKNAFYNEINM